MYKHAGWFVLVFLSAASFDSEFAAICVPGMCQLALYVCIAGRFTVRLLQSQGGSACLSPPN